MFVINGRLRANTSLSGAKTCCGVHARQPSEKPDTTDRRPPLQEVLDIPFTRHLRGYYIRVSGKETEV
jgi:hypothetical protein